MGALPTRSQPAAGRGTPDWRRLIDQLLDGRDLTAEDIAWVMGRVMSGAAAPAQVAGFLVALRAKGETPAEVAALAETTLGYARPVRLGTRALDIVGTGGDRSHSVNISTMAALVAAAAGATVAKVGNRSATSRSGAADVLERLGVAIDLEPEAVAGCVAELGIGFLFGPVCYPALGHIADTRRALGVATIFNLLGPLLNPARPSHALVGCAFPDRTRLLAEVFARRGSTVLLVRGDDGLDELTTTTTSSVWVVQDGTVTERVLDPLALGIPRARSHDLRGGDAAANAETVRALVRGGRGAVRDAVLLNAAAALATYDGFSGSLEDDLAAGLERATRAVDSGAAADLLARWVKYSDRNRYSTTEEVRRARPDHNVDSSNREEDHGKPEPL
ncbi:anthranilate phosphoribosyltransferase [Kitasatospora sp. NPDC058444]|uniref:anthranilate phosphoribosyltransferase n=1 Tax=Kitasatospora sp. NPDC058444 TaxID=3346504 RepID=UPI00364FD725